MSAEKQRDYLKQATGWKVTNGTMIEREFRFKDFDEALSFVNKVGAIAQEENHHPDISLHNYNRVKISLTTHKIKGLSRNDFIMAAKINEIMPPVLIA